MRFDNRLQKLKEEADFQEAEIHLQWLKRELEKGGPMAVKIVDTLRMADHNYPQTMSDEELDRRISELITADQGL